MRGIYQRRHAERGIIRNRQHGIYDPYDDGGDGGGFTLSGPLTITIRTTLPASTFATSTSGVATSSSTLAPLDPSSSKSESLSQTSSSSFTLSPSASVLPPSSTPSNIPQGNSTIPQGINGLSTPSLSSGGIAGIVIACLLLLFIGLFFGFRQRFQRNRVRLRGLWTRTKSIGDPALMAESSYEPKSHSSMTFRRSDPSSDPQFSQSRAGNFSVSVAPPPIMYNNDDEGTSSPYGGILTSYATISNLSLNGGSGGGNPTYSPGSANLSPFAGAMVMCTFITSLPDELSIKVGETIHVLMEYDDGWALCMNANGQQGMVPMECLNGGRTAATPTTSEVNLLSPRLPDARGIRRASSLTGVRP